MKRFTWSNWKCMSSEHTRASVQEQHSLELAYLVCESV